MCNNKAFSREKLFGFGRPCPLGRDAKLRIMARARALMRRTQARKAYGAITAKTLAVLNALLWTFHNERTGVCFPSLERVAECAGCARSTAALAIKQLEAAGVMTWAHRIVRVRIAGVLRVIRTSNAYEFRDTGSKSDFRSGPKNQESSLVLASPAVAQIDASTGLGASLAKWRSAIAAKAGAMTTVCPPNT